MSDRFIEGLSGLSQALRVSNASIGIRYLISRSGSFFLQLFMVGEQVGDAGVGGMNTGHRSLPAMESEVKAGAITGCRRSSAFWGLGRPKMHHEIKDTLVSSSPHCSNSSAGPALLLSVSVFRFFDVWLSFITRCYYPSGFVLRIKEPLINS